MEKDNPEKKPSTTDHMMDAVSDKFKWWNQLSTINAEDPIWLAIPKILVRIIGILFLLAISPFVILGLLLGIMAAG